MIYPTVPKAKAWPVDNDPVSIQADEMLAGQLGDAHRATGLRGHGVREVQIEGSTVALCLSAREAGFKHSKEIRYV